ncbi:hypothetical protein BASA50_011357 [Batrachochytrium salamandrivorans]|uniref:XPA C-terminal domain-containing protein n=1 Tax=Batrachochytrium salamandrivorans TaxID=1357716 RepID=A0ABQ8EVU5_9FUNG|nr:hypothetical protein BASA60_009056 [Batrachochytrium salamandrivorans]KAH6587470.1 hypothetical protein BASA50_011357 [Batrachochytrium salamandrivorans]KAH9274300.1 DNA repair protein [Batrachochytrium salamandrivorans]
MVSNGPASSLPPVSDEQLAIIDTNRKRALVRLQGRQNAQSELTGPESVVSTTWSQEPLPTHNPPAHTRKRRAIDLTYCEYNLTTMKDTKGGFIIEEPAPNAAAEMAGLADANGKGNLQNGAHSNSLYDRQVHPDPKENPQCAKCDSIDVDPNYEKNFGELVCRRCRDIYPDEYSLLTKTECREDYLLTDSELKDSEKLPNWIKANPHKSTYSNMLLYLRKQVEEFAWSKWGSPEALDAEFIRRNGEKQERKAKKFSKKLSELRAKTRTSTWTHDRNKEHEHEHEYGPEEYDEIDNIYTQTCTGCGMSMEFEAF